MEDPDALAHRAERALEAHDFAEAGRLARLALKRLDVVDPRRAAATLQLAIAELHLDGPRSCAARCAEGLSLAEAIEGIPPLILTELIAQQAVAYSRLGLRERALELNLRALGRLRGDRSAQAVDLVATVHNNLAIQHLAQGDLRSSAEHLERGLQLLGDRPGAAQITQRLNLGQVLLKAGDGQRAAQHLEEGWRRARATQLVPLQRQAGLSLARARRLQGRLDEAEALLRDLPDADRGQPLFQALYWLTMGEVRSDRGVPGAEEALRRALGIAEAQGLQEPRLGACRALAQVLEAQGRFEDACAWHRKRELLEAERFAEQRTRHFEELRIQHEIAQREQEEARLRLVTQQLEALVQRRTSELHQRNQELAVALELAEAASRAKGGFLTLTSHELRTPLNAIIGYTELLMDEVGDLDPDTLRIDLVRVLSAARRLERLVSRILTLTSLEEGQVMVSPRPLDLGAWLGGVVEALRPSAAERGIRLSCEATPLIATTDPERLEEILLNLLDNALGFATSEVSVSLRRLHTQLQLEVHDDGPGLPAGAAQQIFQPFQQQDMSFTRERGGLGIGLALCAHLCELLGGSIEADTTADRGCTFRIQLPLRGPRHSGEPSPPGTSPPTEGPP